MAIPCTSSLSTAIRELKAGSPLTAFEAVLSAWRNKRHDRLVRLIEALDRRLTWNDEPVGGGKSKADDAAWMEEAHRRRPAALAMLMTTLRSSAAGQVKSRLEALSDWDDPRIPPAIMTLMADPPWRARPALPGYRKCLDIAVSIGHPDLEAHLERLAALYPAAIPTTIGIVIQGQVERELAKLRKAEPAPVALIAEEEELCSELEALLREESNVIEGRQRELRPDRSEQRFLDAIYEDSRSDEPRAVFADWLIERNDPRGEFIAMQLAAAAGQLEKAYDRRAELSLLHEHEHQWSGPIGPAARHPLFHRGFASWVHHWGTKTALRCWDEPAWATVETISYPWEKSVRKALMRLITSPRLRGLNGLKGVPGDALVELAEKTGLQRIQRLGAMLDPGPTTEVVANWLSTADEPRYLLLYKRKALHPVALKPDDVGQILDTVVSSRLKVLALETATPISPWLEALEPSSVDRISFYEPHREYGDRHGRVLVVHAARGTTGKLDRLTVVDQQETMGRDEWQPFDSARIAGMLKGLPFGAQLRVDARDVIFPSQWRWIRRARPTDVELEPLRALSEDVDIVSGVDVPAHELSYNW